MCVDIYIYVVYLSRSTLPVTILGVAVVGGWRLGSGGGRCGVPTRVRLNPMHADIHIYVY